MHATAHSTPERSRECFFALSKDEWADVDMLIT